MKTESTENYLKTLFTLGLHHELVPFKAIVDVLGVTPGTATTMMKRLALRGLVNYQAHKGVTLTAKGKSQALTVIRRHRLLELFLVRVLGFNWSEVHREAEVLEHAVSDELMQRIDAYLGHPQVDPHGAPIPSASGKVPKQKPTISLDQCQQDKSVQLRRVATEDTQLLSYLDRQKIRLGDRVTIVSKDIGAGVIELKLSTGRRARLSLTQASNLLAEV